MAWPTNPTDNQQATVAGVLYQYSAAVGVWNKVQLTTPTFIADGATVTVSGNFTAPGNISGNYILGNGSQLSGINNSYGNANVAAYLPTYSGVLSAQSVNATGNIAGGNIRATGIIVTTGNVSASYLLGNGSLLTGITASGTVLTNNISYTAPFTGAVARTQTSKNSDTVNVKDFGATGNGTTDDRAAIQAAIDTGKHVYMPTGTYRIGSTLGLYYTGQIISGDGRTNTVLIADYTQGWDTNSTSILYMAPSEPGASIRDLGVKCVQPDTATRGSLYAYPVVLNAKNCPRFQVINCKFTNAMYGIDMRGNSGGATIEGLEMSCYTLGIQIDGSLDTVRVNKLQYWPFDMTGNQSSIFFDSSNKGMQVGRCDDLKVNQCLFINGGIQIDFIDGTYGPATGACFGCISDTDFDNNASLRMNQTGGIIAIQDCFFTIGVSTQQPIVLQSGNLKVIGCDFSAAVVVSNYQIVQNGGVGSSYLQVIGCRFTNSGPGAGYININNGDAVISDNYFLVGPNQTWSNPLVYITNSGRVNFNNNRARDKGTGTGNLLTVTVNNAHVITNNSFLGWKLTVPSTTSTMIIANNGTLG